MPTSTSVARTAERRMLLILPRQALDSYSRKTKHRRVTPAHELTYQPGLDGEPRPGHIVPRPGELAQARAAGVEAQAGGAGHFAPQAEYLPRQARGKH